MAGLRGDWTLAEADAALPRVRALLREGREALAGLREAEAQLTDLRIVWGDQVLALACPAHAEWQGFQERRRGLRDRLDGVLLAFHALGCEPKDLDQGLVDFQGLLAGRAVCLCWRDGEGAIEWWHPLETGFAGRQRIPRAPGGPPPL